MAETQDDSQASKLYATISVLMAVLVITTITRITSRLRYHGRLTADDYFILLGTSFNVIADGMEIHAVGRGFGRHSRFIASASLINALKYMQLGVVMAILAVWAIKVSVCLFLLALVRDVHQRFIRFVWGLMALTTVTSFITLVLWGIQANPIQKLWNPHVKGTRRSSKDFLNLVIVWNTFNLVTDLIYSVAPLWFVWNTKISRRDKLSVFGVTGSALTLTAVVILCFVYAHEFLETEDITWALVPEFIADSIQRQLSGIIANLPAIFLMFRRHRLLRLPAQAKKTPQQSNESGASGQPSGSKGKAKDPYSLTELMTEDNIPLQTRGSGSV